MGRHLPPTIQDVLDAAACGRFLKEIIQDAERQLDWQLLIGLTGERFFRYPADGARMGARAPWAARQALPS